MMGVLCLLASVSLAAQTAAPAAQGNPATIEKPATVALVSGTCPAVHGSDLLALDWSPDFEDGGLVTGLRTFTLTFSRADDENGSLISRRRFTLGRQLRSKATPGANGIFHIEIPVPRSLPPGTYRLVDAHATPSLPPEDRDQKLEMMNSPADSGFCITMTRTPPATEEQSSSDAQ